MAKSGQWWVQISRYRLLDADLVRLPVTLHSLYNLLESLKKLLIGR
jgi:hypothetical protein